MDHMTRSGSWRRSGVSGGVRALAGCLIVAAGIGISLGVPASTAGASSPITVSSFKHLVGNESVTVSGSNLGAGSGASFVSDASATVKECAAAPGSCITLATGIPVTAGSFSGAVVLVRSGAAGPSISGEPVCGVSSVVTAASGSCSLTVVGSPSGTSLSKSLSFNYPSIKLKAGPKGGGYVTLTVTSSAGFPLGSADPVELSECDSQNASPSAEACDAANGGAQDVTTVATGGHAAAGAANGNIDGAVIIESDGSAYAPSGTPQGTDGAGGTCAAGATCHAVAVDQDNPALRGVTSVKTTAPAPNCSSAGPNVDIAYCDLAGVQLYNYPLSGIDATGVDAVGAGLGNDNFSSAEAPDADFSGADLDNGNFTDANLSGDNLTDADLSFSTLTGTDLAGAQLAGANLANSTSTSIVGVPASLPTGFQLIDGYLVGPKVDLGGAHLTGADLAGADLESTGLDDAVLTGANIEGTDFTNAMLSGVVSGGLTGTPAVLPANCFLVNGYLVTYDVNLTGVDLSGAVMPGISLNNSTLVDVNLSGADLDGAYLSANLSGADLSRANLYGASFYGAGMPNADLDNAVTTYDDFSYADMAGDNLTNDDFTDVSLLGATLTGADLDGVNWNNTVCPDSTLSNNDGNTCINDLTPES